MTMTCDELEAWFREQNKRKYKYERMPAALKKKLKARRAALPLEERRAKWRVYGKRRYDRIKTEGGERWRRKLAQSKENREKRRQRARELQCA